LNINPLPKLHELVPIYRTARMEAGHPIAGGDDLTILMPLYVGESRSQITQDVTPSIKQYARAAASVAVPTQEKGASEAQ
jgi:hypothetical protein